MGLSIRCIRPGTYEINSNRADIAIGVGVILRIVPKIQTVPNKSVFVLNWVSV